MTIPPKKVINADAGDANTVGGNDWDDVADWMSDVDKTGPVKINTDTRFRSGKKRTMNPANTFGYIEVASAILANRNVIEPLLTADDTKVYQAFSQTLTNKTIDVISNKLAVRGPWTILLLKSGSTYYAIKHDGIVISSSTTAETVISAAIANKGVLCFANNNADSANGVGWDLSAGFAGFTLSSDVYIRSDSLNILLSVPQGFSGTVFKVGGSGANAVETVSIEGITISEQGTPQRLWTGIKLEAATDGASFAQTFKNIEIYNAGIGIELETTGTGFITNCVFRDISIFMGGSAVTGFLFDIAGGECSENLFQNIQVETQGGTGWGFKNITGTGNTFINSKVWDAASTATESNITSGSSGTIIIGGRMTGGAGHFIDQGNKTLIIDSGNIVSSSLVTRPDLCKMGGWSGSATTVGDGMLNGRLSQIAIGTGSDSAGYDSTGGYRTFDTGTTINSISGVRMNATTLSRILNCYFKAGIYLDSGSNIRVFCGLVASSSAPASASDPLNTREGVALWLDTAVSGNWKRMHNDSSGASTVSDTTFSASVATLYPIEIYGVADSKFRFVFNGVSTDLTSNIPGSTTALAFWLYMENTTGAARTMRGYYAIVKNDK